MNESSTRGLNYSILGRMAHPSLPLQLNAYIQTVPKCAIFLEQQHHMVCPRINRWSHNIMVHQVYYHAGNLITLNNSCPIGLLIYDKGAVPKLQLPWRST